MAESPSEIGQETRRLGDPASEPRASAPTTDEIRSHIEQTRADISHTIDAIQTRLSPSRLVTDAKQTVKDATIGRVKHLAAKAKAAVGTPGGEPWTTERIACVVTNYAVPIASVGAAALAVAIAAFVRSRNRVDRTNDRPRQVMHRTSADPYRARLLAGVCVGLGCWSAWQATRLAREGTLSSDLAQPM
jgi:hypothetical protein